MASPVPSRAAKPRQTPEVLSANLRVAARRMNTFCAYRPVVRAKLQHCGCGYFAYCDAGVIAGPSAIAARNCSQASRLRPRWEERHERAIRRRNGSCLSSTAGALVCRGTVHVTGDGVDRLVDS